MVSGCCIQGACKYFMAKALLMHEKADAQRPSTQCFIRSHPAAPSAPKLGLQEIAAQPEASKPLLGSEEAPCRVCLSQTPSPESAS